MSEKNRPIRTGRERKVVNGSVQRVRRTSSGLGMGRVGERVSGIRSLIRGVAKGGRK